MLNKLFISSLCFLHIPALAANAHPPARQTVNDAIVGFEFDQDHVKLSTVSPAATMHNADLTGNITGRSLLTSDALGESLELSGTGLDTTSSYVIIAEQLDQVFNLPEKNLTLSSWVRIDEPTRWGGVISAISDNGDKEQGWVLGYDNDSFTFGISTEGADDGDGVLTYVDGESEYKIGRWYHVAATYDGVVAKLYINGQLDAQSSVQSGNILYNMSTPLAIGAYIDSNEVNPLKGRIRNAYVYNRCFSSDQIAHEFEHLRPLAQLKPETERTFQWTVEPFLCYATQTGISIVSEVSRPASIEVRYRPAAGEIKTITTELNSGIHTVRIEDLEAGQPYYYEVVATDELGNSAKTDTMSFQTAVERNKAFSFVMIGDTQSNPHIVKRVSDIAWAHRPNFVCLAGDLVTTGTNKSHWTQHFFPNMQPLIGRIPLFPVLGNHEKNARHYYEYMDLPDPEYYYSFQYGDADYFVLDSEKPIGPGSEQYRWLESQLSDSQAKWKFVIHHRPAYSSEENDHGDSWHGPTELGDPDIRKAVPLYEQYGVDIVFNGHIHAYERTFPIRENEAVDKNGVIYMTIGGGGGGLEQFAPFNPWFGNKKSSTHHLCFVTINGGHLQLQSIDDQGRLFDMLEIRKD